MLAALLDQPAVWGLFGAFLFGAHEWQADVFHPKDGQRGWQEPTVKFLIILACGALGAWAAAPVLQARLHLTSAAELRGISALLGLMTNPLVPALIPVLNGRVLGMIKGGGK